MTHLERKIIRRAAEIVAEGNLTSISAIVEARKEFGYTGTGDLYRDFRVFYEAYGCPFTFWPKNERLRTIRVLLLETFLIFDGELG